MPDNKVTPFSFGAFKKTNALYQMIKGIKDQRRSRVGSHGPGAGGGVGGGGSKGAEDCGGDCGKRPRQQTGPRAHMSGILKYSNKRGLQR
jgi:hypothetical protein